MLFRSDLSKRRVWLLRRGGIYAGANATALRAALEGGRLRFLSGFRALTANELLNRWHKAGGNYSAR